MQLEDYFEFEQIGPYDRIRVKGTRIAIEIIIWDYLGGYLPEQIVHNYVRSLTLEQVFATLTYYLHNKAEVDAYIRRVEADDEAAYQEYLKQEKSEVVKRLIALRAQQEQNANKSS